ncbi:RNA polymerase sigma-70 factor (ECF subfamily) [Flavobacteriaceae bacterium MAR_2009_75]|nr:RNA polymerase sigma-70 factor (ECF subfamily) [Flavobacteriaceae bacterium MAR_2009_75]
MVGVFAIFNSFFTILKNSIPVCNKKQQKTTYTSTTYRLRVNKELEHQFVTELENNQNIVHKVCTLYTNDRDAHNDLFQEITIQLWRAYPKFRGESKFSTWMYRVALNTAITLYRKSKRTIKTQNYDSVIFRIKADEYDATEEEQLKLMYQAVKQLGDIEKALVFLYLEDKDYREISETLGITEVNARVKMNRIKKKLRTILNP